MVGAVVGAIMGATVFGAFIALGILLSSRVGLPSLVPVLVLGGAGAYAGWLVGVIVFSAVRGPQPDGEGQQS